MDCEQRELSEHEIALLRGLADAADHGAEIVFGAITKRVSSMRLAATKFDEIIAAIDRFDRSVDRPIGSIDSIDSIFENTKISKRHFLAS